MTRIIPSAAGDRIPAAEEYSAGAVIAEGGPAGLTAAYELTKHGRPCVVLETDLHPVGGISRADQCKS